MKIYLNFRLQFLISSSAIWAFFVQYKFFIILCLQKNMEKFKGLLFHISILYYITKNFLTF